MTLSDDQRAGEIRRFELWVLAATWAAALFLAARRIDIPSLYYDECCFVNAARGGKTNIFQDLRIGGIPILLVSYIGALKAWIYYPIFSILKVSPATVRLPTIVLGLIGGTLSVCGLRRLYGRWIVAWAAPLLLLDPSVLMNTRLDWGQNALTFLLRGLLIFAICSWLTQPRIRWLVTAVVAVLLGVFDRLNFLWCAIGFLGPLCVIYWPRLLSAARAQPRRHAIVGVSLLAIVFLAGWRAIVLSVSMPAGQLGTWGHRWGEAWYLTKLTLAGGGARDFVSGDGLWLWPWFLVGWLGLVALSGLLIGNADRETWKRIGFWWMAMLLTGVLFYLTRGASGPHHSVLLAGLPQIGFLAVLAEARRTDASRWQRLGLSVAPVVLAYLVGVFVVSAFTTVSAFDRPTNTNWDPANDRAAQFAVSLGEVCIAVDWGLGTLLVAHSPNPNAVKDVWGAFATEERARAYVTSLGKERSYIVLSHTPKFENFRDTSKHMISAFQATGWQLALLRTFDGLNGKPMVKVFRVSPQ